MALPRDKKGEAGSGESKSDAPPAPKKVMPLGRKTGTSGRPLEDRPSSISFFMLQSGFWTCKCGTKHKISVTVCTTKIANDGPCGRHRPLVRVGAAMPISIANKFINKCAEKGINYSSALALAIGDWSRKED